MDNLCERTLCLYKPGVKMQGMKCHYIYTGKMPCTGRLACQTCGKTKPEERK